MKYQDYYQTLGVSRDATQDQIQKAYRKLARKFHPDVNKASGSEDQFKKINEANEVLKDPEKRKLYDQLGSNWQAGQDFKAPPGAEGMFNFGGRGGASGTHAFSGGDFSDFFEALFGGGAGGFSAESIFGDAFGPGERIRRPQKGQGVEAEVTISLEDAFLGGKRTITLQRQEIENGKPVIRNKSFEVKIPAAATDGMIIRLSGQGQPGAHGGSAGDLHLRLKIAPHKRFKLQGYDLTTELPVSPWEASLGADVSVPLIGGSSAKVKVPPGSQNGQRLRLKGKGFPKKDGGAGDLFLEIKISVPHTLSEPERELFEKLKSVSSFNPRQNY